MNTPLPPPTPPVAAPTAVGVLQSLLTGWLAYKGAGMLGLGSDSAVVLAGGAVSVITSTVHTLAQRWHLTS